MNMFQHFFDHFIQPLYTLKISTASLKRLFSACGRIITKYNYRVLIPTLIAKFRIVCSTIKPQQNLKRRHTFDYDAMFPVDTHENVSQALVNNTTVVESSGELNAEDADVPFQRFVSPIELNLQDMDELADEDDEDGELGGDYVDDDDRHYLMRSSARYSSISVATAISSGCMKTVITNNAAELHHAGIYFGEDDDGYISGTDSDGDDVKHEIEIPDDSDIEKISDDDDFSDDNYHEEDSNDTSDNTDFTSSDDSDENNSKHSNKRKQHSPPKKRAKRSRR